MRSVCAKDCTIQFFGNERAPQGTVIADPKTRRRWAEDDYEVVVALNPQVARDMANIGGVRGVKAAIWPAGRVVTRPTARSPARQGETLDVLLSVRTFQ